MAYEFTTKITIDKFMEAGGSKEYPNLVIGGIVSCQISDLIKYDRDIIALNRKLDEIAQDFGYTHIFGVKYEYAGENTSIKTVNRAIGTGYKFGKI